MTATIRKQIQRSKEAAKGLKRIELTLTREQRDWLDLYREQTDSSASDASIIALLVRRAMA